ncbi:MAG: hypothetical protein IT260_04235 [Saprospiraceae bacterium]|nr:hypothetical protein [Saprospiraceae bacterium]
MFELTQSAYGKYRRYTLHQPDTGHGFSIVPACGANVDEICFGGFNVLDGYQSPEEMEAGKWGKSAFLFPFPNRLRDGQYQWLGKDYTFPINSAPTGNAIHGFVRHERFDVTRIELCTEYAELSCQLNYRGNLPYYPFPFVLEINFRITNRNEFNVSFFLKNRHHEAIPVALGWHPYFRLCAKAEEHQLQLPACSMIDIDERMIPTGTRQPYAAFRQETLLGASSLDNCFVVEEGHPLYHLTLRGGGHSLALVASSSLFPYFQVFTPPARDSIALEPMTGNVNVFQNGDGLVTVPAAGDWTASFRLEYYHVG